MAADTGFSLITLVHNRQQHLENVLTGLRRCETVPDEVIIVHMDETPCTGLDADGVPLKQLSLSVPGRLLPLAQARNMGARHARCEHLVFLDVDCIPHPLLLTEYALAFKKEPDSLLMGEVYYCQHSLPDDWDNETLQLISKPHPARCYELNGRTQRTSNYSLFWSLNFAVRRSVYFNAIGGFYEGYYGYGGEDTDFAFTAKTKEVPLAWVRGAAAYHQYHPVYVPPLNHFEALLRNATLFHQRWGQWPMEKWLQGFADLGYIRWSAQADAIEIIRAPSTAETAAARSS